MVKVSVFYPNNAAARFDMNYYLTSHMPMVAKRLGSAMKGMAVDEGLGGMPPGTPPPYRAVAHILFDSMDAFGAAFAEHGGAIQADIPNYTDIAPTIQISQVKL